jgi:hypothetical protein
MNTASFPAIAIVSLLLIAACSSTPRLSETPTAPVDLTGRWALDREASDDPVDMITTAMVIADAERGNGARGLRAGGDGKRGSGGMPGGGGAGRGGMGMMDPSGMIPNPDWIDITQSADLVEVDYGGQRFGRYPLQTPITTVSIAGSVETKSGWSGTDFWTVTKSERGLKLTERYVVSPDGSELVLETVLDSKAIDDPLTIRRVFHPES